MNDELDPSQSDASRLRKDPIAWLWGLMGLALIAYGGWQISQTIGISAFGTFLVLVGVTMIPFAVTSIVGGVGLLVWAGWWTFTRATFPMDYLYSALAAVFGLTAIIDRVRTMRRGD